MIKQNMKYLQGTQPQYKYTCGVFKLRRAILCRPLLFIQDLKSWGPLNVG